MMSRLDGKMERDVSTWMSPPKGGTILISFAKHTMENKEMTR